MKKIFCFFLLILPAASAYAEEENAMEIFEMSLEELMQVKIVSLSKYAEKPGKAPGTVYVWTEEEIIAFGFRNLQDVLEATPGFEITNSYFWLMGGQRGFNNNMAGTVLLIDGRRLMLEYPKEAFIMEQFPLNMIQRIEIVQGPISILYGSEALQGVINIITKGNGYYDDTTSVDVRYGSFNSGEASVNFRKNLKGDSFIWASASYHSTDNPDLSDFVDDDNNYSRNPLDAIRVHTYDNNNYFYSPNNEQSVNLAFAADQRTGKLYGGLDFWNIESALGIERISTYTGMNHNTQSVLQPFIGYEIKFLDNIIKFDVEYIFHTEKRDAHLTTSSTDTTSGEAIVTFLSYNFQPSLIHKTKMQIDVDLLKYNNYLIIGMEYFRADYGNVAEGGDGQYYVSVGGDSPYNMASTSSAKSLLEQDGFTVYLQDQQTLFKKLHLTAGARYNHQSLSDDIVIPRGGIVWEFLDNHSIKFFYGRAFKTYSPFSLIWTQKEQDYKPSIMDSYEVSFVNTFPVYNGINIMNTLSGYRYNAVDYLLNLEVIDTGTGEEDWVTRKTETWTMGFEDQLKVSVGEKLFSSTGVSFVRTKSFELNGEKTHAYKVPQWKVNCGLFYNFTNRITLGGYVVYHSEVKGDVNNISGTSTEMYTVDPFTIVNLALTVRNISLGGLDCLSLQAGVHNLFNKEYYHINNRSTSPIQYLQEERAFTVRCRIDI